MAASGKKWVKCVDETAMRRKGYGKRGHGDCGISGMAIFPENTGKELRKRLRL